MLHHGSSGGQAGAQARGDRETAAAKNEATTDAGLQFPDSFDLLPGMISDVQTKMAEDGQIIEKSEGETPQVPMDYSWAGTLAGSSAHSLQLVDRRRAWRRAQVLRKINPGLLSHEPGCWRHLVSSLV